jgi:phosphoribosyl 1,2-cyclic phosphodiesterase
MIGIGGNTPCIEITLPNGDALLIDCGTGATAAGRALLRRGRKPGTIHLFLSHFHWDHIQGLPFFAPLFKRECTINFYSGLPARRLPAALRTQFSCPYFPVPLNQMPAKMKFVQISDEPVRVGGADIFTFQLHHPQGAWGCRIEANDGSIVYASDHEHGDKTCDEALRRAAQGADILIYDAHFTPREYGKRRGWGHSTWREGTRLANEAKVKTLILFHHSPERTDSDVDTIIGHARKSFDCTIPAREGLVLSLHSR